MTDIQTINVNDLIAQAKYEERQLITGLIKARRDFHISFAHHSLDAGVEPSDSIYTAITELNALLRELEEVK